MGAFFRMVAAVMLSAALAYGGETPNSVEPKEKTLGVSVTVADDNKIAEALDLRDLEHFIVSELKANRVDAVAFTSVQNSLESDEGVYTIDVGIDVAEIAQRPKWSRLESRYRDDEILHLELSLSVTRLKDNQSLGDLNRSFDYRAADYGRFSSPQAIKGAVYEAVAMLSRDFIIGVEHGDFGEDIDSFQHPFGFQDLVSLWRDLPVVTKVGLVSLTIIFVIVLVGLLYRVLLSLGRLFVPRQVAPQLMHVVLHADERQTRKAPAVLEAYTPPKPKAGQAEDEDEEEAEEDKEEEEEPALG